MSTASDDEALAESEGKAMPGVELKLVTIEGKVCGIGEEGEVRAKAPQLMLGYLDESLHADAFDEDGFFRPATSACSTPRATSRSRAA